MTSRTVLSSPSSPYSLTVERGDGALESVSLAFAGSPSSLLTDPEGFDCRNGPSARGLLAASNGRPRKPSSSCFAS